MKKFLTINKISFSLLLLITPILNFTILPCKADLAQYTASEIRQKEMTVNIEDSVAMFQLGLSLEASNLKKACHWYKKSVETGNFDLLTFRKDALYSLGRCYEDGEGLPRSVSQAISLYEEGDLLGSAEASNRLGLFYLHGLGVSKNLETAKIFLQKTTWYTPKELEQLLTYDGTHCPAYKGLVDSLIVKAETGDRQMENNVGCLYHEGKWVSKDDNKAFQWMKKAAEHEHAMAQFSLSYFYENGIGIEKNDGKAFEWIKRSAENGVDDAKFKLSLFYFSGTGTPANYVEGVYWYFKAQHWI